CCRFCGHVGKAGDVAARTRQARHQSDSDRVRNGGHHDWNGCCCLLCSQSAWGEGSHNDIYLRAHELSSQLRQPTRIAIRGTQLEGKVATLRIAEISEPEPQFPGQRLPISARQHEDTDLCHLELLCARRKRPHRSATEQRDERTAITHSITSSASASSPCG